MFRRIWLIFVRLVKSLFAPAPDPRKSETAARQRHEDLLARIADARSRVQTIHAQLERRVTASRREAPRLLDEARRLVETGHEDAARVVLRRRQTALDRIRLLDELLARVIWEGQTLASVEDGLKGEIAVRSAHQDAAAARFDAAEARATVTEALTGVSDDFSGVAAELRLADERAEHMESRADALDELVEIGVLRAYSPTRDLSATSDDSDRLGGDAARTDQARVRVGRLRVG